MTPSTTRSIHLRSTAGPILGAALLTAGLAGCAFTRDTVHLDYEVNPTGVTLPQYPQTRPVVVTVSDQRSEQRRIGVKAGASAGGIAHAVVGPIVSDRPETEFLADAVTRALQARGVRVEPTADQTLQLDVLFLANEFKSGVGTSEAEGTITCAITVVGRAKNQVYTRILTGVGRENPVYVYSGANAKRTVEAAVAVLIGQLMEDAQLVAALSRTP